MTSLLRRRVSLIAILGVFLIPIVSTNLRGLTHVLTCEDDAATPFSLQIDDDGVATISSSTVFERDPETGEVTSGGGQALCGGLSLSLQVSDTNASDGAVRILVPITNLTDKTWRGSVELTLGSIRLPVGIGRIAPGATESDELTVHLGVGVHQLEGALLIGP